MNVLITSSRMPHALDQIRKFGREGHEVFATDTFRTSPGNHSKYAKHRLITSSPTFQPRRFLDELESIICKYRIDLLVPGFEEVFPIAKHLDRFRRLTSVFCPPFDTLAKLHDKNAFVEFCQSLDLATPETRIAHDRSELRQATQDFSEFLARPAYSRGGVELLTNVPPRAGALSIDDCTPTATQPWIVQRYVHGEDVCSFSVAHRGRLAAHCTYIHPKTIEHAGGISFESIDEPESVAIASKIIAATGYHGQVSFDFMRTARGLTLIECNPRPTAGSLLMESAPFVESVLLPDLATPHIVPAGVQMQITSAIVRDMLRDWHAIPSDLRALFSGVPDAYAQADDMAPGLFQILSYSHVFAFRRWLRRWRSKQSDLVAAQFFDIAWDGSEIP